MHHAEFFSKGTYPFVEGYSKGLTEERARRFSGAYTIIRTAPSDAVIVVQDGKLVDAAKEILDLIAAADVILGTGHLRADEACRLVEAARAAGVQKIVVPHPTWKVLDYKLDEMKELARLGAFLEHCATICQPQQYVSHGLVPDDPNDYAVCIRELGAGHCLMSTDSGVFSVPVPAESMRVFVALMLDAGISEQEIDVMIRKNPAKLLNLPLDGDASTEAGEP
jgi:hypothetical protein